MISNITNFLRIFFNRKKISKIRKILRMKKIRKIRILDLWSTANNRSRTRAYTHHKHSDNWQCLASSHSTSVSLISEAASPRGSIYKIYSHFYAAQGPTNQGRNHGWKVEGRPRLGYTNTGALAGCWVQERVAPSRCEGPGVLPPENFLKTQMLNPAFWWLLAVKFLAFWKLRPRSWGDQYVAGTPNLKVGGTILSRSLWLLHLCGQQDCGFANTCTIANEPGSSVTNDLNNDINISSLSVSVSR